MSRKTIAKFSAFVIYLAASSLFLTGCFPASPNDGGRAANNRPASAYGPPNVTGKIENKEIRESSGVAASRCSEGVLWTHNDSGNAPVIYALNATGRSLGEWTVQGAKNGDWEDIAALKTPAGECFLYIGDTGNNTRSVDEFTVYRVREPEVGASPSANKGETAPAEALKFTYPDFHQDAETLLVHPQTGDIYVVTKKVSGAAGVYKLAPDFSSGKAQQAKKVTEISVPAIPNGFLTGGSISPDGTRLVLCDYFSAYEFVLPPGDKFEDIFGQKPSVIELGRRDQGEAISYSADGNSIFATSEKKNSPIIEVKRK